MTKKNPAPVDLSSLELDLANSFVPSWAKETDSTERMSRMAEKDSGGERRGGFGKRRDDRGPRPGGGSGGGSRPPRPADRSQGSGSRNERSGGRPVHEDRNRSPRPERESRPEILTGWNLQFIPDRHGVEGMAKQIKTSAKAYPLFDLAKLVLEKPERYLVEFKRASVDSPALFQCKADGSVWSSEGDAVSHVLGNHVESLYRKERVAVEPPKGVYPFIAVCGMSGTLLGPSNYHDYPSKISKLHAERFSSVPFDVYKSRIKMVKDEESIQKWKEEQSWKDEYFPQDPAEKKVPHASLSESAEPADVVKAQETVESDETVEGVLPEETPDPTSAETTEALVTEEGTADSGTSAPEPEVNATTAVTSVKLSSLAEVERHFRETHLKKAIVQIRERVLVQGVIALNTSSPAVVQLVRYTWDDLRRFPLPLAHTLSRNLSSKGLQIFKAHQNITYVSVARPKYLERETTPVSVDLRGILEYLEANASAPRDEQFKAMVALRPEVAGGSVSQRESAVAADLLWLLREGHIIDFSHRGLEAARKPQIQGPGKKKPAKEEKLSGEVELQEKVLSSETTTPCHSTQPVETVGKIKSSTDKIPLKSAAVR